MTPDSATASGGDRIVRGYFALGDHENVVRVTSTADFLVYIAAINVDTFNGGVQVSTPPSQFRTPASSGPGDGLTLECPPRPACP